MNSWVLGILIAMAVAFVGLTVGSFIVEQQRSPQPVLLVEVVELPGDRFVECIRPVHARGVTCNWEAANAD